MQPKEPIPQLFLELEFSSSSDLTPKARAIEAKTSRLGFPCRQGDSVSTTI